MPQIYDSDYAATDLQRDINSGLVWHLEGSVGRSAMDSIRAGRAMVGKVRRTDYWGNTVPARSDLEPGSFGTREFVADTMGEDYAASLEAVE